MALFCNAEGGLVLHCSGNLDNHIFDRDQLSDLRSNRASVESRHSSGYPAARYWELALRNSESYPRGPVAHLSLVVCQVRMPSLR
jgi:hypothetical protein